MTRKSLIETYQEFAENLWISKIFKQDFGTSDVITNYSRIYSWMANQLGHMTLGLGVTLLFVWATDTIALALKPTSFGPWPWITGALSFVGLALLAGILAPHIVALSNKMRDWRDTPRTGEAKRTADASFKKWQNVLRLCAFGALAFFVLLVICPFGRGMLVGFTIALLALATVLVPAAILRNKDVPWRGIAIGTVVAAMVLAVVVLVSQWPNLGEASDSHLTHRLAALFVAPLMLALALSIAKSGSYAIAGCVVIAIGMFIASNGFFLDPVLSKIVAVLLALAFAAAGINIHFKHPAFRPGQGARVRKWFQASWFCCIGAIPALVLLIVFDRPGWELPLAAAIISMAIWTMKEVGLDLQVVDSELKAAEATRWENYGSPTAVQRWATPDELKVIYYVDAGWDLATDCGFYLAGAVIGAGILSHTGVVDPSKDYAWASGVEIIGLVVFVALFLALGRNWGYRQFAVDRSGVTRADRLAVIWSKMHLFDSKGAIDAVPLLELHKFARDDGRPAFKHLFIVGGHAVGKGPVADALVTEAALANAPSSPVTFCDMFSRPPSPRSSRMISAQSMIDSYHRTHARMGQAHNLKSGEIRLNPTHNLYQLGKDEVVREPEYDGAELQYPAASFVCINDYAPSTMPHSDIAMIVGELDLKRNPEQATTWIVSDAIAAQIARDCLDEPSCDAFFSTYIDPIAEAINACFGEPGSEPTREDFSVLLLTRNLVSRR